MNAPATPPRRRGRRLAISLLGMTVSGAMNVVGTVSLVALVYAAVGPDVLADGLGLALAGTSVAALWIARRTSMPGAHAVAQSLVAVIVAVAVRDAVALAAPGREGATALTVVVAAGLTIGVVTTVLGQIGAARLVRYLPHPVVAGVVAAGGWLLVASAIEMMSGTIDLSASARGTVAYWAPGLAIGIALFVASRLIDHPLVVPGGVGAATAAFYGVAALSGSSVADLSRAGWLFGPLPDGSLLRLPPLDALVVADWGAVLAQGPALATAAFAAALLAVVYTNALELDHGVDMVPRREVRETGIGNLLGAVFAAMPTTTSPTETQLARTMQLRRRGDAVVVALVPLAVLAFGAGLLEGFPRPVLGGVLVNLGLKDLGTNLFPGFRRYARVDLLVVLVIVVTVAVFGLLPGIGVGLAITVAIFVGSTAGEDVVAEARSGAAVQSRVTRGADAREALSDQGERTAIFPLRGTVFFGTADRLTAAVRERLDAEPRPWSIVLDVTAARTFDATGGVAVLRIARAAERAGVDLYVVGAGRTVRDAITRAGAAVRFEANLDAALEACEERALREVGLDRLRPSFDDALSRLPGGPAAWSDLQRWFSEVDARKGERLIVQGEAADDFLILADGRVSAVVERDDGTLLRLESLVPGQVVGELGFVTEVPRSAHVVADETSRLYRMERSAWSDLAAARPDLAVALRDLLLRLASERVQHLATAVAGVHD